MAAEKSFNGCDPDYSQNSFSEVRSPHIQKIDIVLSGVIIIQTRMSQLPLQKKVKYNKTLSVCVETLPKACSAHKAELTGPVHGDTTADLLLGGGAWSGLASWTP